ncbi:protein-methionine-sulfoxide reductase catalytic subunit MsrP [Neorhodopirellula pilleata]|uniref:Protein-methionine-sulfoxide reductase catalytic subunit MsrP n=1 Tax=Neorhodopirellula pilleata TaxID=2714738 RepID=A0A5C6A1H2_9BACT|nr:protein-methionine-sulfoxide reductase catalytic subunit MsrP [Neorhodopirellula pilleata]TWT93058.1 Sulfoxide reductase catalytic subunit YedY precursor [Neorhodopirellula pilleata]
MSENHFGSDLRGEVTPYPLYANRRRFLRGVGAVGTLAASAGLYRWFNPVRKMELETAAISDLTSVDLTQDQRRELGFYVDEPMTSESSIISYNNFYEFTTDKNAVADTAKNFDTTGWQIRVEGMVHKPTTFTIPELKTLGPIEERIYRMRCVEAWSMVIPWAGLQLSHVIDAVEPMSEAKYVAFETLYDPERMPGQKTTVLQWPYVEGLRLDEAMHPLTLLAVGLYGKELPAQDGAPVRLVTPWKYGFKGIKSIVKISLLSDEPPTSWNRYAPSEYGFLANVNPNVPHPRWSQATEQRIGETGRRQTLMFNGYEDQVASLYEGLDLSVNI